MLRDFGDRNPQEDLVIHFYELFLKKYDAKKRTRHPERQLGSEQEIAVAVNDNLGP